MLDLSIVPPRREVAWFYASNSTAQIIIFMQAVSHLEILYIRDRETLSLTPEQERVLMRTTHSDTFCYTVRVRHQRS